MLQVGSQKIHKDVQQILLSKHMYTSRPSIKYEFLLSIVGTKISSNQKDDFFVDDVFNLVLLSLCREDKFFELLIKLFVCELI
jgi:hypothetical protein